MTQRTRRRDDNKNLGFLENKIRGSAVPGPLVLLVLWFFWSPGPLGFWSPGFFGLLVFLVSWSPSPLGPLVPWSPGPLVSWLPGAWSPGPPVFCPLASGCFSQLVVLFGSVAPLTQAPTSHHQQYFKTTTEEHRVEETIQ